MRCSIITLAFAASVFASPVIAADSEKGTVQLRVSPDDAETPDGARLLYERIKTFAHGECDRVDDSTARNPNAKRCMRNLVTQFVEGIDKPLLDAAASEDTEIFGSDPR